MGKNKNVIILAIESSCDDTSAALISNGEILSNVMASQDVHNAYGGVVPELASRAHQLNIIPVVNRALTLAGVIRSELTAIAFTRGPGLLGSLLVGASFAKGMAFSLGIPMIDVNHLQGHLLSPFITGCGLKAEVPAFPYISLLVSGGHTQIVRVDDFLNYTILGGTIDDAVGEAFDKCAKVMNLDYPGGPVVDRLAKTGNPHRFVFAKPRVDGYNYSFSGLKTSFLYFLRDRIRENPAFIEGNLNDLCASFQNTLIAILMDKLIKAAADTGIKCIASAGGVSANSALRAVITEEGKKRGWRVFLPDIRYTTDNAAMISIAGYYRYLAGHTAGEDVVPVSRPLDF